MSKPIALFLIAGLALAASPALAQPPAERITVKTVDDLPRHTYKIEGKASEFLTSDKPFQAFLTKLRADLESDLAKYDIKDPTTLQGYYSQLQQIATIQGRDQDALGFIEKIRALEGKESKKLMTGQVLTAALTAKKAGARGTPAYQAAFKTELEKNVGALNWDLVREDVARSKGTAELVTRDLMLGQIQGQLDPVVEASGGELSGDLARSILNARAGLDVILPVNPMVAEVYGKLLDARKVAVKDIWTERLVTLPPDKGTPVVVAIWDSGVDTPIFSPNLWTNAKETVNGKDDDGNGFVDDVHGIGYDLEARPVVELLHPINELRNDKALVASHTKGIRDLQANIDSPEAAALRKHVGSLKPEAVTPFLEDLNLFGSYAHGTHVAGIAAEGNPFIRVLPVRITFDFRQIPTHAPSLEQAARDAKATRDTVAYMKAAGVRVVNMSWGGSRKDIESSLEKKGVGSSAQERAELSRQIFKIQRDALDEAIKSAPEILFIAAAGNSDNDNTFAELIPSGLSQPNLITIGAVDQSGKPTGFTTFGKGVSLYANGFEVDSYVPGGQRMKFSGTSMAAPNVANLAAKLLALNPKLTTAQVIDMISKGADPMAGYDGRLVINPKKSVAMVKN